MIRKKLITIFLGCTSLVASAGPSILSLKESITDNAIVYPESFETDTHKMLQNWYLQKYAVLDEDVANEPDGAVTDEVLIQRLNQLPTVIEMPFNQIVRSYINMYTERRRALVENMLGMSLYYMPIFEQALEKEGLPLELKYLPVIESALNPDAVSRVGATGLWQFMLPTARSLGMEVNSLIDQRRDPYSSSEYAAKYLKQLYSIYNDWSLAIAAYNCGPGNVNKAIRRAENGNGRKDFWDIYYYLPRETRGYVPAFIAANYVMTYYKHHNISPALARRPLITDSIHVNKRVHLQQIADVLKIPIEEIRVLNPQFRRDIIPGDIKPYALTLPSKQVSSYIMSEDSILAHNAALYARRDVVEPTDIYASSTSGKYDTKLVVKYHKVKRGETLSKVARRYGVSVSNLRKWNKLGRRSKLKRGQRLRINTYQRVKRDAEESNQPVLAAASKEKEETTDTDADTQVEETTTKVSKSSKKHELADAGTSRSKKQEVTKSSKKKSSKKETASKKKKKKQEQSFRYHKVRKGETLSQIAEKYRGVSIREIRQANGLSGNRIKAGQRLKIPRG